MPKDALCTLNSGMRVAKNVQGRIMDIKQRHESIAENVQGRIWNKKVCPFLGCHVPPCVKTSKIDSPNIRYFEIFRFVLAKAPCVK